MACVAGGDTEAEVVKSNYLEFQLDGKLWKADNEVFGSYHLSEALGPKMIQIAGNQGTGPTQQAFNINLFNTDGMGIYKVNSTSGMNVAQLGNLSQDNYLCGGVQQASDLRVEIIHASKSPQQIEARFEGTLQCVNGQKIKITNGKFYYHED